MPGPPPPPPPMPMMGGGAPPPPPMGGLKTSVASKPANRDALLGDIQGGFKLKKVDKSLISDRSAVPTAGGSSANGSKPSFSGSNNDRREYSLHILKILFVLLVLTVLLNFYLIPLNSNIPFFQQRRY